MPTLSYNGQAFAIDGRRIWILGATLQYARIEPTEWAARIADARQAGFNTIVTSCPWSMHEPRRGRYRFDGDADVRRFLELCGEQRLRVILRAGPFIEDGFDGGGLPPWLLEEPDVALRQANDVFLDRTGRYFRKLLTDLTELQVTKGGPLLLVQVEHGWMCGNEEEATRYLGELARLVRECGISVPLFNTNNLWAEGQGTIDTWWGETDLLANLRQLRTVQPNAPRLVTIGNDAAPAWGTPPPPPAPDRLQRCIAEVLAAGGQPIIDPFHGGTNFGFLAGRTAGPSGGFATTSAAAFAPLGEAGGRGPTYHAARQLATFASSFAHLFADLDEGHQPTVLDPDLLAAESTGRGRRAGALAVVPQRGAGGQVVFVFGDGSVRQTTLLLGDGTRLPVDLGSRTVSWYAFDVDLDGAGRLDYANVCPLAIVNRSVLVLFGHAKTTAFGSIDGTPFERGVPGGGRPVVFEHKGVTVVLLNEKQAEQTFVDGESVYVGISGLDLLGAPRPARAGGTGWRITSGATLTSLGSGGAKSGGRRPPAPRLSGWEIGSADDLVAGTSPRFAGLPGPRGLPACGAQFGYGWYRAEIKASATKKHLIDAPASADRLHVYVDGRLATLVGSGPGAASAPFELRLTKGVQVIVALADNFGRHAGGNAPVVSPGIGDELYECKALRAIRPKTITGSAVNPLDLQPFILGAGLSPSSEEQQLAWTFTHARKSPVAIVVDGADARGTFVLNDVPIHYYGGASADLRARIVLDPTTLDPFKRGKNVVRFAPDPGQSDALKAIGAATTFYEYVRPLTASWAFAKWEPPAGARFDPAPSERVPGKVPCWWRCSFEAPGDETPLWLHARGLSKGQVYVNGHNLGRYFTSTATGRSIGPQTHLLIPRAWLRENGANELLLFDEHGALPSKARLVHRETGDLDE